MSARNSTKRDVCLPPRFPKVWCSSCGREFPAADSGYSHCRDHARLFSNREFPRRAIVIDCNGVVCAP